VRGKVDEFMG